MKERLSSKIIIITLIIIGVYISGCIFPGHCDYSHSRLKMGEHCYIILNSSKIDHEENLTSANITIKVTNNKKKEMIWKFDFSWGRIDNMTSGDRKIFCKLNRESRDYEDHVYTYQKNTWSPFKIELTIQSDDEYLKNKTFFNNSNIIKGKIWVDDETTRLHLNEKKSDIKIEDSYTLVLRTDLYIKLEFEPMVICVD